MDRERLPSEFQVFGRNVSNLKKNFLQMHPATLFVCDDDATMELKVKTVKYFKGNSYD